MERYKTFIIAGTIAGLLVGGIVAAMLSQNSSSAAPDFSQFEAGPERKQAFFDYFLPIVQERNEEILETRKELAALRAKESLSSSERRSVSRIASEFGIEPFQGSDEEWRLLMRRVDVVPPSLALAQAANESAWGTSRFAVQGNNYFGQWCFSKGCGIVPARRDEGATHEVADFSSPAASVESYIRNLNRHNAYRELRDVRARLRQEEAPITGIALAAGLTKYSERGEEYIDELRSMIRFNKLGQYDGTQLASLETEATGG